MMQDGPIDRSGAGWQARRDLPVLLGLLAVVLLVYVNALPASFQFDDFNVVVDNPRVHDLATWWREQPAIRPLLKLSYTLNWIVSPAPWGFHAFNIAVHALNTGLVWLFAGRCLRQWRPQQEIPRWAPASVALLFALHPATTEAVTYVSGRSVSLMATFYLASLLAFDQGREQERPGLRLLASPLLFALALAVRETAITLPLAILLLAWSRGDPLRIEARAMRGHWLVLAAASAAAAIMAGYRDFLAVGWNARDFGSQLTGQLQAHAYLFGRALIGLQSNIDPDVRVPNGFSPMLAAVALGLAAAVTLAVSSRRRRPWLAFGLLWYLLQLAPTNSFLPRLDLANDRHLYLALPGIAIAGVGSLLALRRRWLAVAALLVALPLCAVATIGRNGDYRSEVALWQATVRASPAKPRAWINLGYAKQLANDNAGARRAYACALSHDPGNRQALINLAVLDASATGPTVPAKNSPTCRP